MPTLATVPLLHVSPVKSASGVSEPVHVNPKPPPLVQLTELSGAQVVEDEQQYEVLPSGFLVLDPHWIPEKSWAGVSEPVHV